jgi:sugar-specific transcriptional regulator TrmB
VDQDLVKLLEQTGFTQKEAETYLALLELGRGTVSQIAKITKLKRSIIYVLLEGLIKRGYVNEIPGLKINTYHSIDPLFILSQLKTTTKNFAEMLPIFRTLHNKGKNRPKIVYHETKDNIWKIYEEMSQSKEAFFISSYERIEKHFPNACKYWENQFKKKIIPVNGKHLVANSEFDLQIAKKFKKHGQQTKYLSEKFDMDFTLYDNKLAITSLEKDPFIVIIESEALVKSMRPFFEIIWNNGKDI